MSLKSPFKQRTILITVAYWLIATTAVFGTIIPNQGQSAAESKIIYVSTTGNDQWSGNLPEQNSTKTDGPLFSLVAAQEKARSYGLDKNSISADPMFVNIEAGDFRFKDGSPALKLGITPIVKYGIQETSGLEKNYAHLQ